MPKARIMHKVLVAMAALSLSLFVVGCGDEDDGGDGAANNGGNNGATNNGDNNGATNNGDNNGATNNGATNNGATNNGGDVMHEAATYRMDSLLLSKPDGPSDLLNGLVGPAVTSEEIIILVQLSEYAAASGATTLMISGGPGEAVDGGYSFSEAITGVSGTVDAAGMFTTDAAIEVLNFPVTVGEETIILPIRNVALNGTVEGEAITGGGLTGAITLEDAQGIEVEIAPGNAVTLDSILNADNVDVDIDEDGTNDAWALEAEYTATTIVLVE